MAYPKCDGCGIDIYPVVWRTHKCCCFECYERIFKEEKKHEELHSEK